jgi:pimeloyl-ACP methyl ester carboxylesterase
LLCVFEEREKTHRGDWYKSRMSTLSELLNPKNLFIKIFLAILTLAIVAGVATATVAGYLVYRMVKPQRASSEINLQSFPGRPDAVLFTAPGGGGREGWFFPGFRGAPTIILCHGYESSRGELLTLVAALQDQQYNVFVFDFAGHGASAGITTLGYQEGEEVRAAINVLAARGDVARERFGLWGYNLGAHAALREAESDKRVQAVVLDSVYDSPKQMIRIGVQRMGLAGFPLMVRSSELSFEWLNRRHRKDPPLSQKMDALLGLPKLFIAATDDPKLAAITQEMFLKAPEPREQEIIAHGNYTNLEGEEKRDYENRVVSFFLSRMPVSSPGR